MITARYRQDYPGEFVILRTTFRDGRKIQEREWVENPIVNQHISGRATVIASLDHLHRFDPERLQRHRGGLHGSLRLQTYSCGTTWRHMPLNFWVSTDAEELAGVRVTNYGDDTVIYTNSRQVVNNPGDFFLIPLNPNLCDAAAAAYLAAFDGHREVFVLGTSQESDLGKGWIEDFQKVFVAYQGTKFILVGTKSNQPRLWLRNRNVSTLSYRQFVTHCDI
jgi:hypothetical protein